MFGRRVEEGHKVPRGRTEREQNALPAKGIGRSMNTLGPSLEGPGSTIPSARWHSLLPINARPLHPNRPVSGQICLRGSDLARTHPRAKGLAATSQPPTHSRCRRKDPCCRLSYWCWKTNFRLSWQRSPWTARHSRFPRWWY
jgi:hypothetical protein